MVSITILVADDETNITDVCRRYLEREGYSVIIANDGNQALQLWGQHKPEFIILDLMMPGKNGWEVCEEIRANQDVPMILLTARGEEPDRLLGLSMGVDDYITKPFSPRELVLRVKNILRRSHSTAAVPQTSAPHTISSNGLVIYPEQRRVTLNHQNIELTAKEFDLLLLLAGHPNQVFLE